MSFIDLLMESTKEYEAPRRFYYWSALSAVSAVLKDRVWFDMAGNYKLYPNIYVLLYAQSGARKGPPIALVEKVVKLVDNTRVINGRATIEAIIKELGTFRTREKKEPLKDSCGFVVASELSSSIVANPSAMDIMTNLYDRIYNTDSWEYKLKVGESVKLTKPTITWLSGTNEALFKEFLPEKNIHGGLIGRMYMIAETKPNRLNSLMYKPNIIPDAEKFAVELRKVIDLKGEFTFEDDDSMRAQIDTWYNKFMGEVAPQLSDETGFVSRVGDFVIKNAMLIAAGRRSETVIRQCDLDESFEITIPLIVPTKRTSNSLKKNDATQVEKRNLVLGYLISRPDLRCGRREILKNLSMRIDHEDLDKVIDLLLQMDAVVLSNGGGQTFYQLNINKPEIAKWLEQYRR